MAEWVCSNCGNPGAIKIDNPKWGSFLELDARYATGYCNICSVSDRPRKTPRKTNQLIRADVFDYDAWMAHREKAELATLVRAFATGRDMVQLTDQEVHRMLELFDRHGFAGFAPDQSLRLSDLKYTEALAARVPAKPKQKRSRGA